MWDNQLDRFSLRSPNADWFESERGSYTFRLIRIGCGLGPETAGTDLGVSRLDWKWGLVSELDGAIRGNVFTRR